jgi:predicted membrane protein
MIKFLIITFLIIILLVTLALIAVGTICMSSFIKEWKERDKKMKLRQEKFEKERKKWGL